MTSLIYDSWMNNLCGAAVAINPTTDTVKGLLVTSSYTPAKKTHTTRNNVTNEVVGTGYTAGGQAVTVTVTSDTTNDREDLSFANNVWTTATISAAAQVLYSSHGGVATGDPLWAYVDFGGTVSSTAGTFTAVCSTPLRLQN